MARHIFTIVLAGTVLLLGSGCTHQPVTKPASETRAPAEDATLRPLSYAELNDLYLQGKISAEQHLKYLEQLKSDLATNREASLLLGEVAREKAVTNLLPNASLGLQTKRDRLLLVLRLFIDDQINEEEMVARRHEIIAGPD